MTADTFKKSIAADLKLSQEDEVPNGLPKTQSLAATPSQNLIQMAQNDDNMAKDLGVTTGSHMHMPRNNSMISLPSRGKSYAANRLSIRFKRALADRIEQDRSTSLINSTNTMFPPSNANSSAFD